MRDQKLKVSKSLMAKRKQLDVWIDKLTNSIVNTISGDSLPTDVIKVSGQDLKLVLRLIKKLNNLWLFLNISSLKSLAELPSSATFFALIYPKITHNLI